jgi:hypothetical protein
VVALNRSVCVIGNIALMRVSTTVAALECFAAGRQSRLQILMECSLGRPWCPFTPPDGRVYQQIDARDFTVVDRDLNQLHPGQSMLLIALIEEKYPVLFETSVGTLINSSLQEVGKSALCYTASESQEPFADPDCDAISPLLGDGAVVMILRVSQDDPRGMHTVRVTQGDISKEIEIQVVGVPTQIVVESLDAKASVEAEAKPATLLGDAPQSDACDPVLFPPYGGAPSQHKTNVIVRALDDDGTEVVGAQIVWTRDGTALNDSAMFGRRQMPSGGSAVSGLTTWDLGALGIGYVQTICGGGAAGTINAVLKFDPTLSSMVDRDYELPFSLAVTGVAPTPTATPTACANDVDCDGIDDSVDNCGDYIYDWLSNRLLPPIANPGQENNDRNFIDMSPPFAQVADDRTRVFSDTQGDACDLDDDNDSLFDVDEIMGSPRCPSASGPTDPFNEDTDGDGFTDRAECAIGTDPLDPNDRPPLSECGYGTNAFLGFFNDRTAFCKFNIHLPIDGWPTADSDGDVGVDGSYDHCEIASLNGDRVVNPADQGMVAYGIAFRSFHRNLDINRDGVLNPADLGLQAAIIASNTCPKTFN